MEKAAAEFLFVLNAAVTNIRLYPPESAIIGRSLGRMEKSLQRALQDSPTLDFAESETRLLVNGRPLPEKQQQKPQVKSFLSVMSDLGIKSLTFSQDADREELSAFLLIVAKPSEQIRQEGGLDRLVSDAKITGISVDEKVYVTIGPDQTIVRGRQEDRKTEDAGRKSPGKSEKPGTAAAERSEGTSGKTSGKKPGAGIRQGRLKETLSRIMKGDPGPFQDPATAAALPAAIGRMIDSGRRDAASALISRMGKIFSGAEADPKVQKIVAEAAGGVIQGLRAEHVVDILLGGAEGREEEGMDPQTCALLAMYTDTVERLLDRLRDSESMTERNRIVQAVTQMGEPAADPVIRRLGRKDNPWYFTRNLALLLGRIGREKHLEHLEPLLSYPDYRVQLEAVKSIQAINGEKAGSILLKNIEQADAQLVSYIISVLGALRHREAVPYLIEILESKRISFSRAVRDEIRAGACEALGRMLAVEAIPVLERIVREKGLIKGQPENVRSAAAKALANIKRGG